MRKLIRKFLQTFDYDIVKLNRHTNRRASKIHTVQVGNYVIKMPGNNPQISNYKYIPNLNYQLANLAEVIVSKYPNLSILDVGANVGDTIAVIKSKIKDIPIIAIEGDDTSFKFLQTNVQQFNNITLVKTFLGETNRTLSVVMEKNGWNNTIIPTDGGKNKIQVVSLDEVVNQYSLNNHALKLLKIDTEGFDTIILRGSYQLLQQHNPIIYFEYNKTNMEAIEENGLATLLALKNYGYRTVHFFDGLGKLILSVPIDNEKILRQLHNYIDEKGSRIGYYDICLFHENDEDIEELFIKEY